MYFEDGKTYIFSKEVFYKVMGIDPNIYENSNIWFNNIDGLEVNVNSSNLGFIKHYQILPNWCKEIK